MTADMHAAEPQENPKFFQDMAQPRTQEGPLKVTLFGASIMEMIYWHVAEELKTGDQSFTVVNEATSGHKSTDGLEKLDRIAKSDSDIVVLSFGGNDIRHGHSLEDIKTNLSNMISTLQDAGKEVVLVGIDPSDLMHILQEDVPESELAGSEEDPFLASIRTMYQELSDEFGIRAFKKSLHSGLNREDLLEDGIHPDVSGIEKIAADLSGHIRSAAVHVKAAKRVTRSEGVELGR